MRRIKLTFTDVKYLVALQNDKWFTDNTSYLNPHFKDSLNLVLNDPVDTHTYLDTEVVVLGRISECIKRLFFPDSTHDILFLCNNSLSLKGGVRHDQEIIIDSTDVQR